MQPPPYPHRGVSEEVKVLVGILLLFLLVTSGYLAGSIAMLSDRVALVEANQPDWQEGEPYVRAWTTFLDVTVQYGEGEMSRTDALGSVAQMVKFDPELALAWQNGDSAFMAMLEGALWEALLDE